MEYWVSPKYKSDKLASGSLEDKIDVFEDQWRGWIFSHAEWLLSAGYARRNHSGLAVLMIVTSYFETIACFLRGEKSNKKSRAFFAHGFAQVIPIDTNSLRAGGVINAQLAADRIADALYDELRCGLFHEAMIRGRIVINTAVNGPFECSFAKETGEIGQLLVNPSLILWRVREHFDGYVKRLRDPMEIALRTNFERFWNVRPLSSPK